MKASANLVSFITRSRSVLGHTFVVNKVLNSSKDVAVVRGLVVLLFVLSRCLIARS